MRHDRKNFSLSSCCHCLRKLAGVMMRIRRLRSAQRWAITKPASMDAFMKRLRRKLGGAGRVDILINNAGRGIAGSVLPPDGGEERYLAQMQLGHRTDHVGHLAMTRRMLPLLPASGYARVCFTVSISAYTVATGGLSTMHGYVAMKRALLASANAWRSALEQARSNIAVTTVNPYFVNTRFPENIILTERAPAGSSMAAYVEALRKAFALGLPPSLVGQAYWQLLSSSRPPANVAAGSAAEPLASRGGNHLTEAEILAENAQAAVRFG